MRIATWNINSVRLRLQNVLRFIKEQNIDVMCLQETKSPDEYFPQNEFEDAGFKSQFFRGEKSYNGVAILSKIKFTDNGYVNWCKKNDTRHIYVELNSLKFLILGNKLDLKATNTEKVFFHIDLKKI